MLRYGADEGDSGGSKKGEGLDGGWQLSVETKGTNLDEMAGFEKRGIVEEGAGRGARRPFTSAAALTHSFICYY